MTPLLAVLALTFAADTDKPRRELLWPKGAPGAVGTTEKDKPALTAHLKAAELDPAHYQDR